MSYTPVSGSERIIDQVLAEAGLEDADDLRPVLLELRSLGTEEPEPNAEVLALMAGAIDAGASLNGAEVPSAETHSAETHSAEISDSERPDGGSAVVVDLANRRRNKRRLPLTVLGVAAALAVGGGAAAAADQGVRDTLHSAFSSIAATFGNESHKPDPKNPTVPGPVEIGGKLQGTPPSSSGSSPTSSGANGSPANGARPGQEGRSQAPADPGAGSGRSSGNPWLNRTPPPVRDVPGAPGAPAPGLTPQDLDLPSLPAVPGPEHTDGAAQP
jgi:hypothetical protein